MVKPKVCTDLTDFKKSDRKLSPATITGMKPLILCEETSHIIYFSLSSVSSIDCTDLDLYRKARATPEDPQVIIEVCDLKGS